MRSETVCINCSIEIARRLGATTCGCHELDERGNIGISFKNFRIRPTDGPNQEPVIWWKWPVVHPGDGKMFLYP